LKGKIALVIALVIIISISISYRIWSLYLYRDTHPKYERTIVRHTSNLQEANALTIAENSNYSNIFNLQRFTTMNHNETWAYTWANFIDTQVIEYYDDRFENLKGKIGDIKPESIRFHYEANVFAWDQIRVVYIPAPEGGSIYDDSIQILSPNGSVLLENAQYTGPRWGMKFAYGNGSEYQRITAEEINFSLAKSYVIEMTLRYDEIWGPLAAFFVKVYQIIIVDQYFMPLLFFIQSDQLIS
jgi:hypothetical protein